MHTYAAVLIMKNELQKQICEYIFGTKCSPDENMPMDVRNSAMQYLKIINTNLDFNSNDRALKRTAICTQIYLSMLSFL